MFQRFIEERIGRLCVIWFLKPFRGIHVDEKPSLVDARRNWWLLHTDRAATDNAHKSRLISVCSLATNQPRITGINLHESCTSIWKVIFTLRLPSTSYLIQKRDSSGLAESGPYSLLHCRRCRRLVLCLLQLKHSPSRPRYSE